MKPVYEPVHSMSVIYVGADGKLYFDSWHTIIGIGDMTSKEVVIRLYFVTK